MSGLIEILSVVATVLYMFLVADVLGWDIDLGSILSKVRSFGRDLGNLEITVRVNAIGLALDAY